MPDSKKVFVVYGRNEQARKAMFDFLRSLSLEPMEWTQAVRQTGEGAPVVKTILEKGFEAAQAVVVLLTGDDMARLGTRYVSNSSPTHETDLTPQAWPNVLFEAGMAFGLHPQRTILVQLGQLRPLSDLGGVHIIYMNDSIPVRQSLAARLQTAGCAVDVLHQIDWHVAGEFKAALSPDCLSNRREYEPPPEEMPALRRMKQEIRSRQHESGPGWRRVETLANKAGLTEEEALRLLQSDDEIELGRGKSQSRITRLRKKAQP